MASPSSPPDTQGNPDNSQNRPTRVMEGGATAYPTPANNVGGGTGWGDEGFYKGGTGRQAPGHKDATTPSSTIGGFESLKKQKNIAGERNKERFDGDEGGQGQGKDKSCEGEDHTFMEHLPGCPHTLQGWNKAKHAVGA